MFLSSNKKPGVVHKPPKNKATYICTRVPAKPYQSKYLEASKGERSEKKILSINLFLVFRIERKARRVGGKMQENMLKKITLVKNSGLK